MSQPPQRSGAASVAGIVIVVLVVTLRVLTCSGSSYRPYNSYPRYNPDLYRGSTGLLNTRRLLDQIKNSGRNVRAEEPRLLELGPARNPERTSPVKLEFALETGASAPALITRNKSGGHYVTTLELELRCSYSSSTVSVRNVRPLSETRTPLKPSDVIDCQGSSYVSVEVMRAGFEAFATSPEGVLSAARVVLDSKERGATALGFLSEYYDEATYPAIVYRASREGAREPLSANAPQSALLARALTEVLDPESTLSVLLAAPERVEPLARRLPSLSGPLAQQAKTLLAVADRQSPQALAMERPNQARAHDVLVGASETQLQGWRMNAAHTIVRSLAQHHNLETARALVDVWASADQGLFAAAEDALEQMPEVAAPAIIEKLSAPSGKEGRDLGERLRTARNSTFLLKMRSAVETALGSTWETSRQRLESAWARRAAELVERSKKSEGDTAVRLAREAQTVGAPRDVLEDALFRRAQQAAARGELASAIADLEEVNAHAPLEPEAGVHADARRLRQEVELTVLRRLFDSELLYERPEVTSPIVSRGELEEWVPSSTDHRLVRRGDRVAFLSPGSSARMEQVLARLSNAQGELPGAGWFRLRALAGVWAPKAVWPIGLTLGLLLFLAFFAPSRLGLLFLRHGYTRIGERLIASGFKGFPTPLATTAHAYALILRGLRDPARRPEAFSAAREALSLHGDPSHRAALTGYILSIESSFAPAQVGCHEALKGRLPKWLGELNRWNLARLAYARGDDASAALHGDMGGSRGRIIAGLARMRRGEPELFSLFLLGIFGSNRHTARALLGHGLVSAGRLRTAQLVLMLASKRDRRANYARARLAHAQGRTVPAREQYRALLAKDSGHGGARLGLALLDPGEYRREALTALSSAKGDSGSAAKVELAHLALVAKRPEEVPSLLSTEARSPEEAELLAIALMRLGRFKESADAFKRAQARGVSDEDLLDDRCGSLAVRALQSGDAQSAILLLKGRLDRRGVRQAAITAHLVQLFRANPAEGYEGAMRQLRTDTELNLQSLGLEVPLGFFRAVGPLARGEIAEAKKQLSRGADALCGMVGALLDEHEPRFRSALRQVEEAHPTLSPISRLLEAAAFGYAREGAKSVPLDDISNPLFVLAAELGLISDSSLSTVLERVRSQQWAAAAQALDGVPGMPCAALQGTRLALAAAAAKEALKSREETHALEQLRLGLRYLDRNDFALAPGSVEARWAERVRKAIVELESESWAQAALEDTASALSLFENRPARDEDVRFTIRHDGAVLSLSSWLTSNAPLHPAVFEWVLKRLEELMESRSTLARYRLRALELAGDLPAGATVPLEATINEKMGGTLARAFAALADESGPRALEQLLQPWRNKDEGIIALARRGFEDDLRATLNDSLETAKEHAKRARELADAKQVWKELDLSVDRTLSRLKAIGADEAAWGGYADLAVGVMDAMSVDFHARFPRSGLPVAMVERAMALTRAEYMREHFRKNRAIMSA